MAYLFPTMEERDASQVDCLYSLGLKGLVHQDFSHPTLGGFKTEFDAAVERLSNLRPTPSFGTDADDNSVRQELENLLDRFGEKLWPSDQSSTPWLFRKSESGTEGRYPGKLKYKANRYKIQSLVFELMKLKFEAKTLRNSAGAATQKDLEFDRTSVQAPAQDSTTTRARTANVEEIACQNRTSETEKVAFSAPRPADDLAPLRCFDVISSNGQSHGTVLSLHPAIWTGSLENKDRSIEGYPSWNEVIRKYVSYGGRIIAKEQAKSEPRDVYCGGHQNCQIEGQLPSRLWIKLERISPRSLSDTRAVWTCSLRQGNESIVTIIYWSGGGKNGYYQFWGLGGYVKGFGLGREKSILTSSTSMSKSTRRTTSQRSEPNEFEDPKTVFTNKRSQSRSNRRIYVQDNGDDDYNDGYVFDNEYDDDYIYETDGSTGPPATKRSKRLELPKSLPPSRVSYAISIESDGTEASPIPDTDTHSALTANAPTPGGAPQGSLIEPKDPTPISPIPTSAATAPLTNSPTTERENPILTDIEETLVTVIVYIRDDTSTEMPITLEGCRTLHNLLCEIVENPLLENLVADMNAIKAVWLKSPSSRDYFLRPSKAASFQQFLRDVKKELSRAEGDSITVRCEIVLQA